MPFFFRASLVDGKKNNEIYHTEDGVPVHTLYLANIQKRKSEIQVKQYFESFGEVESVRLIRKTQRNIRGNTFLYGFVTFTKSEFAAKALNQESHVQFSKHMKVKSADTCNQPEKERKTQERIITETCENEHGVCSRLDRVSIRDLNDDCLHHIFSFLSQSEILKLSFVCPRFNNAIKQYIKANKFDLTDVYQHVTLIEARQILSYFGKLITRLNLRKNNGDYKYQRYMDLVALFCHYLEEIHFENVRGIHYETFKRLLTTQKRLKTLTVRDCDVTDHFSSLIGGLRALQTLNLSNNIGVTGQHLKNLTTLKVLNLLNCENIQNKHFIAICNSIKLKSLNIVGCHQLDDGAFDALIATQTKLETFAMSNLCKARRRKIIENLHNVKRFIVNRVNGGGGYFCTEVLCELSPQRLETLESLELYSFNVTASEVNRKEIVKLKNLRKLCIVGDCCLDDSYLAVIANHCKRIEELNIAGASDAVTEAGIVGLVENLKNLKRLNLSHCKNISYMTVGQTYLMLETRQSQRAHPLVLYAFDTLITREDLNDPEYQTYRKVITVLLEPIYFEMMTSI